MTISNDQIIRTAREIMSQMSEQKVSLFSKDYWYGAIMDWSMKNPSFKTQMFRFVDVLPSLNSPESVTKHLEEYFADQSGELPKVFNVGLGIGKLLPSAMAKGIRSNVTQMAKMFIAGANPQEAVKTLRERRVNLSLAFTIDILGEATLSEQEALTYHGQYLELMDLLSQVCSGWEPIPLLDEDHLGPIPKVNVSVKLTALCSRINEAAWDHTKEELKKRLRPLMLKAQEKNIFLNLDMEHYHVKDLTLEVFSELIMEPPLRSYRHVGCVIQAYLRDSWDDLQKLITLAKNRGTPFTIRLVKGAYWDTEIITAQQRGWPVPVFQNKAETDVNYEECTQLLLSQFPHILVAFGSHNVRSIACAIETAKYYHVPLKALEVQMLYGMADPIKRALVNMGIRVREYAPMGEMLPGMSYLVRRLLENTSNQSWLRSKFVENQDDSVLLRDPRSQLVKPIEQIRQSIPIIKDAQKFNNEPLLDFTLGEHRNKLTEALQQITHQFPLRVQPRLNGKAISCPQKMVRISPNDGNTKVAEIDLGYPELADQMVHESLKAFEAWSQKTFTERAQYLFKVAELMNRYRYEIIATQVWEVGKPWSEADADVAEAIDFCRYYAQQAAPFDEPKRQAPHILGESSFYRYRPRGVTLVISPWNFPLAIFTGQTVAALVTGNTVIMKPAEQSSATALWLARILEEAGVPTAVAQFLPGKGEEVGAHLVGHKDITTIAFTGSKSVGLWILKEAQNIKPGQKHVKRCIIEMGGKNAVIVDNDADLDEAVGAVVYSAFGFSGQKCSACSRVIVLNDVYHRFVNRLIEATRSLVVESAVSPRCQVGPVVDEEACARIKQTIQKAKQLFPCELELATEHLSGCFVGPTIFSDVDPNSFLAQEEIFGPVLAIMRAEDIPKAVALANNSEYALTGGIFSRSPKNIEYVKKFFQCGNLYINRGITGAMVDRHPFGGFKLSGVGSKTGGPDYLLQFMEPQCVTENTIRRGFTPELVT
ncbi:MAG: proline dehydrogenase family protein [Bdellovibrionaceae bacterium]|nr:proline dehydrogenase family protein [Pseudobdellovibrionaceae bacterium]MDW8190094.1 proline dehydrogenase family protein [Pseudobdellovibrionaceae bacterium]